MGTGLYKKKISTDAVTKQYPKQYPKFLAHGNLNNTPKGSIEKNLKLQLPIAW